MRNSATKLITGLICLMFVIAIQLNAKEFSKDEIKKSLPKLLGTTNEGTDFNFTFPPCWEVIPENDLIIYVSSPLRTKVCCEIPNKGKKYINYTYPNEIICFELSIGLGQCYRKRDTEPPEKEMVYKGCGVHVYSDNPIVVYAVTRYGYTSDGFLAIPANYCGTEYITASWADPANNTSQWLTSYTGIVGIYENTSVKFTMGGNQASTTASGTKPGETTVWKLNSTDVLLIGAIGSHSEMTGSKIVADKPVSVVSANFCAYIPTNCGCCDFISEMELPTYSWGRNYLVTPIYGRKKSSMLKVFASEPMTKIYNNGKEIGTIKTAGGIEGEGWLALRADITGNNPVVISGDKPISVTQYNTGQSDDNISSDPFQMQLLPVEMYQNEIWFNTPGIRGGLGYPKNYINVCYQPAQNGQIPHDLTLTDFDNKGIKISRVDTMTLLAR